MAVAAVRDLQLTFRAMKLSGKPLIAFEVTEDGQHLVVGPGPASHLRPGLIVLALAANVDHRVDRATATENIALRHDIRLAHDAGIRF